MKNGDNLINCVSPEIAGGRYPVKTEIDQKFVVRTNLYPAQGIIVELKYRKKYPQNDSQWKRVIMEYSGNYWWEGFFQPDSIGIYEYTVEAKFLDKPEEIFKYSNVLELMVEPVRSRYAAWYEMFHRSQGKIPGKSATFKDMEQRLDEIKWMGFDVIYLPPIHPIGKKNRKGANNSVNCGPNDPGSPWAVGNEHGGHKAINPELGTLENFRNFVKKCKEHDMDVAIDIAITCSPDHPFVKEHPSWFYRQPDGTIKYAENPPKKYEDIYPLNFYPEDPEDRKNMWNEMKSIFLFWIEQGVSTFRIDNPHTKPTEFWEWLIKEIKKEHPEIVFLAEAFTEYDKLELLAKIGYQQSYTYFTWRNKKLELIEYLKRLTDSDLKYYLKGNLFTNTPDILPPYLQTGGRPAFKIRAALASTLSSVYGIYNTFELCENKAIEGKEEYLNSEKYEYKVWDWDRPGNIKEYISKINQIRRENSALHFYDNLKFYESTDENVLCYGKMSTDRINWIIVVANLDPFNIQKTRITIPIDKFGIGSSIFYQVKELITGSEYQWKGNEQYIYLNPHIEPVYIFKIEKSGFSHEIKKPSATKESIDLAEKNIKPFLSLREKALMYNDVIARRQLTEFYEKEMVPFIYYGPNFNLSYKLELDKLIEKIGYTDIISAYISTPGK